jgi:hypothetical protein
LQRIGTKPAYSSRMPPSRARRVRPVTSPVAYVLSDTRRILVASKGVRRISAKNLGCNVGKLEDLQYIATYSAILADPR